jgi:hypothetical protein
MELSLYLKIYNKLQINIVEILKKVITVIYYVPKWSDTDLTTSQTAGYRRK